MNKILAYITVFFGIMQAVIILFSWMVTALMPDLDIRSLLSSEGVRWYFGNVISNMSTRFIVDLLLLSSAVGSVKATRLWHAVSVRQHDYRVRMALRIVFAEIIISLVIILMLTVLPHAILLSVSGHLFPSSFTRSLVPVVTFVLWCISATYSYVAGPDKMTVVSIFDDFTYGLRWASPLILATLVGSQLISSFLYVFS